ncbi:hypothetical protein ABBQ32_001116 [Trebouxia sp. C0010 RCD-2024]
MDAGQPATDDGSRISLHFLSTSLKLPALARFESAAAVNPGLNKQAAEAASAYLRDLTVSRSDFISKLDSSAANTDAELDVAVSSYISLLLGLVNSYAAADATAGLDQETDARLQALLGAGQKKISASDECAAVSQQMLGNAPGRHCLVFQWQDVLIPTTQSSSADTVYELASALVATAVWKQRRAVYLCQGGKQGTSSDAAIKAYSLLRSAGGLFQFAKEKCTPLLANICPSLDCNSQVLQGHMQVALADAQSITVLRAIQKGNAPSLVAALACDTAAMYQAAAQAFNHPSCSSHGSKACRYAEWKLLIFQGYMYAFTGLHHLKSHEGGKAVQCAGEATSLCQAAVKAAAAFDKAAPASVPVDHVHFDVTFGDCSASVYAKCKRQNDTIYYNHIPEELPTPPEPKRLVTPTGFQLPAPSLAVLKGVASTCCAWSGAGVGSASLPPHQLGTSMGTKQAVAGQPPAELSTPATGQEGTSDTACWRWLLVIIALPLLAIISVVGIVVWVVLLPLKCCCCPVGMIAQLVWDAFEWMIKAPLRGLLWASGKPWKPTKAANEKQNSKSSSPV